MKRREFPAAIQSFTAAIALHPNDAAAYYSRGAAQQNLEQNEAAVQSYSEAIRLAPEMAHAYAARGVCLVRLQRDADALTDFQRALWLKPKLAFALNGRGGVHFRRKEYRMALADYDAARSEEHTSELQSLRHLVCRLLLEKKQILKYYILRHGSAPRQCASPRCSVGA